MTTTLKPPHVLLAKIIGDAADIANSERAGTLPAVAKSAGSPFRENNNLSSSDYLTMSYDQGILTGLQPDDAALIDIQMRQLAQMAMQMSLVQNQDLFVALIIAGVKDGVSYVGGL